VPFFLLPSTALFSLKMGIDKTEMLFLPFYSPDNVNRATKTLFPFSFPSPFEVFSFCGRYITITSQEQVAGPFSFPFFFRLFTRRRSVVVQVPLSFFLGLLLASQHPADQVISAAILSLFPSFARGRVSRSCAFLLFTFPFFFYVFLRGVI